MGSKTALCGAEIIDVEGGRTLSGRAILVEDGRITGLPAEEELPCDAARTDCRGKYVMPGLIDMHVHFYGESGGKFTEKYETYAPIFLSRGITTVRSMGELDPEAALRFKSEMAESEAAGPRVLTAATYFDRAPALIDWMDASPDTAALEEKYGRFRGRIDLIKVYNNIGAEDIRRLAELGRADGLKVYGHLGTTTASEAIRAGISGLEHGFYTMTEFYEKPDVVMNMKYLYDTFDPFGKTATELVELIVENDVAITPTNVPFVIHSEELLEKLEQQGMFGWVCEECRKELKNRWERGVFGDKRAEMKRSLMERQLAFLSRIHERGGRVFAGTDTISEFLAGSALVWEAQMLQKAGMSTMEVLRSLTCCAAEELGLGAETGAVAPGKSADLIVLGANPLETLENLHSVEAVYKMGRRYERAELEKRFVGQIYM